MSGAVTAAVVGGVIAGGAGIAGSAIQSSAAGKAASTQAQAATQAAQYQQQATQQALDYQKQQNLQTQANLAPYQQAGTGALSNLSYLLGVGGQNAGATPYQAGAQPAQTGNTSTPQLNNPNGAQPINAQSGVQSATPGMGINTTGTTDAANPNGTPVYAGTVTPGAATQSSLTQGAPASTDPNATGAAAGTASGGSAATGGYGSLLTPYQDFSAPTGLTMQNDPGYQARLQLGTDALQRSAAAKGNVLSGATGKALDTYAQDYASNEYGNVYNRALQGYQTNQGNYYTGQNNTYSRLMGLTTNGQNAATSASSLGQSGANSVSNTVMQGANATNQQNNNAAAATASGYAAQGSIYGSAASGIGNNISNLTLLQQMNKSGYGNSNVANQSGTAYSELG